MTRPDTYGDEPDDLADQEVSKRSRGVALALCFFGGWFGLHRFYVNKPKTGIAMLCTFGGVGIWWLYDMVLLAAGEFRDADDQPLRLWAVDEPPRLRSALSDRRVEELEYELDGLRQQFDDLAERVDFAERMLAQKRETPPSSASEPRRLPRG